MHKNGVSHDFLPCKVIRKYVRKIATSLLLFCGNLLVVKAENAEMTVEWRPKHMHAHGPTVPRWAILGCPFHRPETPILSDRLLSKSSNREWSTRPFVNIWANFLPFNSRLESSPKTNKFWRWKINADKYQTYDTIGPTVHLRSLKPPDLNFYQSVFFPTFPFIFFLKPNVIVFLPSLFICPISLILEKKDLS